MRFKAALLSTALASLLLSTSTLAAQEPAPQGKGDCRGHKEGRMLHKMERMERRLDRAVEKGRLTQAQAEQFKAEGRQLRDEFQAQRQAGGGQLTEEQKQQFRQRKQALRQKVKAAMKATSPQDA